LREAFRSYGRIVRVVLPWNRVEDRCHGYGFVEYDSAQVVSQLLADSPTVLVCGKAVRLGPARPQPREEEREGRAGGGGGGAQGIASWERREPGGGGGGSERRRTRSPRSFSRSRTRSPERRRRRSSRSVSPARERKRAHLDLESGAPLLQPPLARAPADAAELARLQQLEEGFGRRLGEAEALAARLGAQNAQLRAELHHLVNAASRAAAAKDAAQRAEAELRRVADDAGALLDSTEPGGSRLPVA